MIGQKRERVKRCKGIGAVLVYMIAAALLFPRGAGAEIVERIVAVVNEEIITLSELRADFHSLPAEDEAAVFRRLW